VLATSCFAFYLLAACYLLIDVKGWWTGAPFFYPGQCKLSETNLK
jgi:heparan-alpha-glucosaminide N-acetyltransferase